MNFDELGEYKQKVSSLFVNSEDLVNLVMPTYDDENFDMEDNWYGGKGLKTKVGNVWTTKDLIGHFFDVPFIYTTVTDTRNCICIDTTIIKANGDSIKEVALVVNVMCHKDNIRLDTATKAQYLKKGYSGNRVDMIVECIGNLLNRNKSFGLGEIKPVSRNPVSSYFPNDNFFGKTITYICSDFMTDFGKRALE